MIRKIALLIVIITVFGRLIAQSDPRLVLPVGHNAMSYVEKSESANGKYLYTYEDSVFIVWDNELRKELFRKNFNKENKIEGIVAESEQLKRILLQSANDKLILVDFDRNDHQIINHVRFKDKEYIRNTSLFIAGNKDSVQFFNVHSFQSLGKLPLNIWRINAFKKENGQSGSINGVEYLLYRKDKGQNSDLIIYYPELDHKIIVHPLPFEAKKVLFLDSNQLIVQKEEGANSGNSFVCYKMELRSDQLSEPIAFHKYAINSLINGLNNEVLSVGNDGRLVKRDKNLNIIAEVDVKRKFKIPSITHVEVDPVTNVLRFKTVEKCKKPREKVDSLEISGTMDYYSLALLSLEKRSLLLPLDSLEAPTSDAAEEDSTFHFIYGLDINPHFHSNLNSVVAFNEGSIVIDENFRINYNEQLSSSAMDTMEFEEPIYYLFNDLRANLRDSIGPELYDEQMIARLEDERMKSETEEPTSPSGKWIITQDILDKDLDSFRSYLNSIDTASWKYPLPFEEIFRISENELIENPWVFTELEFQAPIVYKIAVYKDNEVFRSENDLKLVKKDKHIFLFESKDEEISKIRLLGKGKVLSEWRNPEDGFKYFSGIVNGTIIRHPKNASPLDWGLFNSTFSEILKYDWFLTYPNRALPMGQENSQNTFNEEWLDLEVRGKEIQFIKIDSVALYDYLGAENEAVLKGRERIVLRNKGTSVSVDPFGSDHATTNFTVVSGNDTAHYKLLDGLNGFDFFEYRPNDQLFFNDVKSFRGIVEFQRMLENTDHIYDPLKGAIYSNCQQKELLSGVKLSDNHIFLGYNEKHKLLIVKDEGTNFIEVRSLQNELLFSIVFMEGNNHLVFDPEFRYTGTPGAISALYFLCGTEIIDLDQLRDSLYVPNLVQRILARDNLMHLPRLSDLKICGILPIVSAVRSEENEPLKYRITPRSGGLGTVELYVNGMLRRIINRNELILQNGICEVKIDRDFVSQFSVPGERTVVKLLAKTKDNSVNSRSLNTFFELLPIANLTKPSVHAIMIGVEDYMGDRLDLNYAAKDANDMQIALKTAMDNLFNSNDSNRVHFYNLTVNRDGSIGTETIKGSMPELNNINRILDDIKEKSKPEDLFILFFSGHGEIVEGEQLLLLTSESSPENLQGIRVRELYERMQGIPAGKRLLILDACYSGSAINDLSYSQITGTRNSGEAVLESQRAKELDRLANKSGFAIITASASNQKAREFDQFEHGLLTYSLLNVMLNDPSVLDERGYLQLDKWFMETYEHMLLLDQQQMAERMVPTTFVVGKVDERVRKSIELREIPTVYIAESINTDQFIKELYPLDNFDISEKLRDLMRSNHENSFDEQKKGALLVEKSDRNSSVLYVKYKVVNNKIELRGSLVKNNTIVINIQKQDQLHLLNQLLNEMLIEVEEALKN